VEVSPYLKCFEEPGRGARSQPMLKLGPRDGERTQAPSIEHSTFTVRSARRPVLNAERTPAVDMAALRRRELPCLESVVRRLSLDPPPRPRSALSCY
jgi:hypothetical protein